MNDGAAITGGKADGVQVNNYSAPTQANCFGKHTACKS